jgi:hypothetical protein
VNNPLSHFSIELTNDTVNGHSCSDIGISNNCIFTTNAGFYNRKTYEPFGTLISEGVMKSDDYQYNTMFGITKKGKYIIGYPTEKDIQDLDFEVLITGIVWLVRDSENFVGVSGEYEKIFDSNLKDLSARTAIGHDIEGNLMVFQVDGKTWKDGLSVKDFANRLIDYGFVNAINLDGGGSVSFVDGSVIANSPTDSCSERGLGNHEFEMCERTLASALCFHNRQVPDKKDQNDDDKILEVKMIEIPCNQTCDEEGIIESKDVVYVVGIFFLLVLLIFSFTVNAGLMVVLKKLQDNVGSNQAQFQIIDSDDTDTEMSLNDQYFENRDGNGVIYDSTEF